MLRTVKVRRILLWAGLAATLLVAAALWFLPDLLGGDTARRELERVLTDALGRPVTIESIEVARDSPRVELRGVAVGEIEPFAGSEVPLAQIDELRLEVALQELLERRVVGTLTGSGVRLHVVRKDGVLNLSGLGRTDEPAPGREPVNLDLDVELSDAHVTIEDLDRDETVELRDVDVRALLSNRSGDRDARLEVTVDELDLHGITVRDLVLRGTVNSEGWVVSQLRGRIGETGQIGGRGRLRPHAADGPSWTAHVTANDVALDGPALEMVQRLFPPIAVAAGDGETAVTGRLSAQVDLEGTGLQWARVAESLAGSGEVTVNDVTVPPDALVLQVAALAGRPPGPWTLPHGRASFELADGWVRLHEVQTEEGGIDPKIAGRVSLSGELDLRVDLMPLVEAFGGGLYARAARFTTSIPVRIEGTIDAPKLRPPDPADVAKGIAGGLLRRALEPSEPEAPPQEER